jgi:hypothetical protein
LERLEAEESKLEDWRGRDLLTRVWPKLWGSCFIGRRKIREPSGGRGREGPRGCTWEGKGMGKKGRRVVAGRAVVRAPQGPQM